MDDIKSMMQNAQKVQENLRHVYQQIEEKTKDKISIGKAGGDLATAHVNMKMRLINLELKPALMQESLPVIAELIVAAVNQAIENAQQMIHQEMMDMAKGMGMPTGL